MRWIDDQIDRAEERFTLTYRFLPTLRAGIEYNPLVDEVAPLVNWLIVEEGEKRPAVLAGTSTDRIGTPDGQSVSATVSKNLTPGWRVALAPYVGLTYGTYEDKLRLIGGVSADLTHNWNLLVTHDGVNVHGIVSYMYGRHAFSVLAVDFEDVGLSYSIAF